ncbi:hypothetical protein [Cysteiniphilum halobium]|uniref:hypothetical protein n=1 Tax=Cysteiniphilum halobium TaxID=2219059 RepID=UPI000E65909C|nr:hypothetical protein [Cysteiniphilum halobium]
MNHEAVAVDVEDSKESEAVGAVSVEPVKSEPYVANQDNTAKQTNKTNKAAVKNKNSKNNKPKVEKEYLLTDESFKRINKAQVKIEEATGFKPSFKRLVNEALSDESVDNLVSRLIEKLA